MQLTARHVPVVSQKQNGFKAACWVFVALAFVIFWNASANAGESGSRAEKPLRATAAIDIVQQIYDKAERYTEASGTPVHFVVSDCRAIYQRDFSREAYSDLFDLPSRRVIELTPTVLSDPGLGVSGALFPARWTDAGDEAGAVAVRAAVGGASVEEVLTRLRAVDESFRVRIEPIVSCSVTAAAEGESRSYRAAFYFTPGSDGSPRFFADHIVQGLERLGSEALPPIRDFTELRRRVNSGMEPDRPVDPMTKALCRERTSTILQGSIIHTRNQEHATGAHVSQLQLKGTCTSSSGCASSCTPFLEYDACEDFGEIDSVLPRVHRTYTEVNAAGSQVYNTGATCKGALACAVESCLYGTCGGIGFSFSYQGFGFQVSKGTPLWNGSSSDSITCPAPEQIIIVKPPRCGELSVTSTSTIALARSSGPTLARRQLAFDLSRGEERPDGSFILEEWAVLSFDGEEPRVTLASSEGYRERVLSAAALLRPSGNQGSTILIVEDAAHPLNSRHIPRPSLEPIERGVSLPKSAGKQELWFRAEIGVDGKVDRLQALDTSKHIDSDLIQAELRNNLKLRYADDRRHRAVVFGIAEIEDGHLRIRRPLVSLPKCCCGDSFCI